MTADLPASLQQAIATELAPHRPSSLAAAAATLSHDYAQGRPSTLDDATVHAAYLAARLPATFAAVAATLGMVPASVLDGVETLLDLGAGPGTATWAVAAQAARLRAAVQVDRSAALLALAARLAAAGTLTPGLSIAQQVGDMIPGGRDPAWPQSDLVVAAYALAELPPSGCHQVLRAALASALRVLVLVEPGTPAGFRRIHDARARCLDAGHTVVAPCSHDGTCPLHATGDWCHFAVRLSRSRLHRHVKGGTLGYEDEKFACLVVMPRQAARPEGRRILRHPRVEKGYVGLVLCTPEVPTREVVTRRDDRYRAARKAAWGDAWGAAPTDPG